MNRQQRISTSREYVMRAVFIFLVTTVSAASWGAAPEEGESVAGYSSARGSAPGSAPGSAAGETPEDTRFKRIFKREDGSALCASCELNLGVGGTYHSFRNTNSVVLPLTVTWSRSRYEFGIFRFASPQVLADPDTGTEKTLASPYWGASLSRRWQLIERGPFQALLGFGVSYKTEADVLSSTRWNFAEYLAFRMKSQLLNSTFEFSVRHWSNGGVRSPNRGQDFAMLTVRFDR